MDRLQWCRIFSIVGAFLVGFWLPLRLIGYVPATSYEIFFDVLISLVSLSNLYLYFADTGLNHRLLRSWMHPGAILDAVCVIPFSLFAFVVFDATYGSFLLINLFAARHVRKIKRFLDGFDSLSPLAFRLIPIVVSMPLVVHLISCAWIALGSGTIGPDPDKVLTYVRAIYWSFTTLTTVGYGDISAKTIPQMLFTCGVQVAGVGVFGYILSNVAGLLARSDAAREHHMDNLDRIETFMRMHGTPTELRQKIRTYYHYMWVNKKGYQDSTLLEGLPAKIQSELFVHINSPIIEKVPFLRGAEKDLIEELMSELEPRVFIPGEKIFKVDELGDSLYFIQNGNVEIILRDGTKVANLRDGSFFGEMALVSDRPRNATAQASTFCDMYILHREAFERVSTKYPHFRDHLEEVMKGRLS